MIHNIPNKKETLAVVCHKDVNHKMKKNKKHDNIYDMQ